MTKRKLEKKLKRNANTLQQERTYLRNCSGLRINSVSLIHCGLEVGKINFCTVLILRSGEGQSFSWGLCISNLSGLGKHALYYLTSALSCPALIWIFTDCCAWIQILSHVSALPFRHLPNPLPPRNSALIFLVYTDHTVFCMKLQPQHGSFSQSASAKPQKAASLMSLSNCKIITKTLPTHFWVFPKPDSEAKCTNLWFGRIVCSQGGQGRSLAFRAQQHYLRKKINK